MAFVKLTNNDLEILGDYYESGAAAHSRRPRRTIACTRNNENI